MYKAILEKIEKFNSIVIFGHLNPDGDCYGSQMAMRQALRLRYPNKQIYAVGSGLHRFYSTLGSMDVVPDDVIEHSLAIIVDGNDIPRMEDQRIKFAADYIKFDHHVDTGSFTEGPFVVKEEATSCCEIILDFLRDNDFVIDKLIAQCLLLGIITDSARFQFVTDFPKVFKDVSFLCSKGANPDEINNILNVSSEHAARFKGFVYSHYQKTKNGVIYLKINNKQLHKFHIGANAASGMVNLISNIRGYPIWAFFVENDDGSIHVEIRSEEPPVQPIALKYGGGGHKCAAGTTIKADDLPSVDLLINDLDLLVKKYKEEKGIYVGKRIKRSH